MTIHRSQRSAEIPTDAIVRAAVGAAEALDVPTLFCDTGPADVEALRQLATYLSRWADTADMMIADRSAHHSH